MNVFNPSTNRPVHVEHKRIHYCCNERDVTAAVHSSAILRVFEKRSMTMLSNFDRILHTTCTVKGTVKENLKSRLFNGVNHAVIAYTATEIEALKDRPFITECHILGLYPPVC